MNSFLNPHTVDKSRPVDPVTLRILSVVNHVAAELELPYIVVGATARDLLLFHVFGIPVTRATADVDFAVAMDSWERFRELRGALLTSGHFREGKMEHRVYLQAPSVKDEIPVDLIPFGGVAEDDVIHWPPHLEQADYDIEFAGAALLGFDARQLCSPDTLAKVRDLLSLPNFVETLAEQIRIAKWPLQPEQLSRILSVLLRFTERLTE